MDATQYKENALILEARDFGPAAKRLQDENVTRLLHASTGLCTEAGELQDVLKRHIFYGTPIDKVNLMEEAGDMMWYLAVLCDALDISIEDAMDKNIAKLRKRYGHKFTEAAAVNRDVKSERKILESNERIR